MQRAAVLRPVPDPLDVRVLGDELLQGLALLGHEIVGERAEALELPPGLELDDAPLGSDGERRVQWQVAVEVTHRVLRRHDQVRVDDPAEDGLVGLGVRVEVADGADADRPGAEDDVAVVLAGGRQQCVQHGLDRRLGGDRELRGVVPAGLVDRAPLADPDHEPAHERHALEELGQTRLVDRPQRWVVDIQAADGPVEVVLERRGDREHVGHQVDLHAHVGGVLEHGSESGHHRLRARHVGIALGIDVVAVADPAERHVLEESGHDDAVVPLLEVVLYELLELCIDAVDDVLVDPGCGGQDGSGDDVAVEGVVGPRRERGRVGLAPDRAGVGEPEPELGSLRRAVRARGDDRGARADPVGHGVQTRRRPRRPGGLQLVPAARVLADPERLGGVGERRHDAHGEVSALRRGRRRGHASVGERRRDRRDGQGDPLVVGRGDARDRRRRDGRGHLDVRCRKSRGGIGGLVAEPERLPDAERHQCAEHEHDDGRDDRCASGRLGARAGHRRSVGISPVCAWRRSQPGHGHRWTKGANRPVVAVP